MEISQDTVTTKFTVTDRYRRYVLCLLFLVGLFNYGDRFMLAVLLPDIKAELDLSDTQIGFITGIGFAMFYAICGIPIARLADRHSRRVILSIVVSLWSLMMALCGLAQTFFQLAVLRILVGVGEAGATPSSQSLISDYYPKEKRASALAMFALSSPVGILLGFLLGGLITDAYGWRIALICFGLPGLFLALVIFLFLRDPPRGFSDNGAEVKDYVETLPRDSLWKTWRILFARRSFFHACMAGGVFSFMFLALAQWAPSFFFRSHSMTIAETGMWLALIIGITQIVAIYTGGVLADRLMRKDMRWPLWMSGTAFVISAPFFVLTYTLDIPLAALLSLCPAVFFVSLQGATLYAVVQNVATVHNRSVAAATLVLFFNLVGGMGPLVVGITSDFLAPMMAEDSLRYALLILTFVTVLWTSLHFFMAARTIREDITN